jgi:HEAT repeat protein
MDQTSFYLLVEIINTQTGSKRANAILELGQIGNEAALPYLLKALQDEDKQVRMAAIEALAKLGNTIATEPLIKMLDDPEVFVFKKAAEALAKLKDSRAVEPLIEAIQENVLNDQTDMGGCLKNRTIAIALRSFKDERVITPLLNIALCTVDSNACSFAVDSLNFMQVDISQQLLEALKSPNKIVRENASWCLGMLGQPNFVEPLIELLFDAEADVRYSSVSALGHIKSKKALPALKQLVKRGRKQFLWS